jgi:hypothetical protein
MGEAGVQHGNLIDLNAFVLVCHRCMRASADNAEIATTDSNSRWLCLGCDAEENRPQDEGIDRSTSYETTSDA